MPLSGAVWWCVTVLSRLATQRRDVMSSRLLSCAVVWCVMWCFVLSHVGYLLSSHAIFDAVRCGAVWCGVVRCGVVWCGVVWCSAVVMLSYITPLWHALRYGMVMSHVVSSRSHGCGAVHSGRRDKTR